MHRSSADSQQLGLTAHTQRVVSVNHLLALSNPYISIFNFKKLINLGCFFIQDLRFTGQFCKPQTWKIRKIFNVQRQQLVAVLYGLCGNPQIVITRSR